MPLIYDRVGAEILVNTQTSGSQAIPNIALLTDGGFVIVWTDASALGADTSGSGIKAQRFDADGNKVGDEFLVNTTTAASQSLAAVATLESGRYVVTWTDASATGGDTSGTSIRAQVFEA